MTAASEEPRVSNIYVDMPNIVRFKGRNLKVNLDILFNQLLKFGVEDTELQSVNLYVHPLDENTLYGVYDTFARTLAGRGILTYITKAPRTKDVDATIINDLWRETARFVMEGHSPPRVRHILVSGDGGFAYVCEDIKKVFAPTKLDMEVYVFARKGDMSRAWNGIADRVQLLSSSIVA